ncbi:CLCN3 [Cordylochernes scorpioides]|uniref:CLCN3 n=1 Tax=Cordylochernes scorpioides TaxID=51811 RepID=A0ABY6LGB3_9ARAC|nr:CLCN3 [Cordylochernes scorpioides]
MEHQDIQVCYTRTTKCAIPGHPSMLYQDYQVCYTRTTKYAIPGVPSMLYQEYQVCYTMYAIPGVPSMLYHVCYTRSTKYAIPGEPRMFHKENQVCYISSGDPCNREDPIGPSSKPQPSKPGVRFDLPKETRSGRLIKTPSRYIESIGRDSRHRKGSDVGDMGNQQTSQRSYKSTQRRQLQNLSLNAHNPTKGESQKVILETRVYGYDPETKRQSMGWKGKDEPRRRNPDFASQKTVLLVTFFDIKGIVHYEYLEEGQTINKGSYLNIMRRVRRRSEYNKTELVALSTTGAYQIVEMTFCHLVDHETDLSWGNVFISLDHVPERPWTIFQCQEINVS